MRIKILSEEKIETLATKENLEIIKKYIRENDSNEWLKELFREEEPFTTSKIEIEDFDMDMSATNPEDTDFENAKRLFEALKNLPESAACDMRLWVGLVFGKFYNYMKYRYNPEENRFFLQNRWLMSNGGKKRGLFKNALSSLWWYVYITYDENASDPYELTKFCFGHKVFLYALYYRAFSSSKVVCHGLIRALNDFEKDGGNTSKNITEKIVKYVSFLGGAYLIDTLSEDDIYEKVYDELIRLEEESNSVRNRFTLA